MIKQNKRNERETELEINAFISNVKYCIESGDCKISVKSEKKVSKIKISNLQTSILWDNCFRMKILLIQ